MLSCAVKCARSSKVRALFSLTARVLRTGGLQKHVFYEVFVCAEKAGARFYRYMHVFGPPWVDAWSQEFTQWVGHDATCIVFVLSARACFF